jgi:hypothetical protein
VSKGTARTIAKVCSRRLVTFVHFISDISLLLISC